MIWLVVIMMINAAISAAYYLRIVATMFLRPEPADLSVSGDESAGVASTDERNLRPGAATAEPLATPMPIAIAIGLSVFGTLLFGALPPATQVLNLRASSAANIEGAGLATYLDRDEPAPPVPATGPAAAAASR